MIILAGVRGAEAPLFHGDTSRYRWFRIHCNIHRHSKDQVTVVSRW